MVQVQITTNLTCPAWMNVGWAVPDGGYSGTQRSRFIVPQQFYRLVPAK